MWKAIVLVGVLGGASTFAHAQDINWLNAHERGTYRTIHKSLSHYYPVLDKLNRAWGVTQSHRRRGMRHDHMSTVNRHACSLVIMVLNDIRKKDKDHHHYHGTDDPIYTVVTPPTVRGYLASYAAVGRVARKYPTVTHCRQLSWDQKLEFVRAVQTARNTQEKISELIRGRKSGAYAWSNTFSMELSPLPFKIEFIEGSAKLKLTRSFGPFKFDFQTGPKRKPHQQYSGLETLIIQTPDLKARAFDIRGVSFSLEVPAGVLDVDGATLTYTCSKACLEGLSESSETLERR